MKIRIALLGLIMMSGCKTVIVNPSNSGLSLDIPPAIVSYFKGLDSVYRSGSTEYDIAHFLDLMTDDVRYVHRNYDANFDLNSWRAAFTRIHGNGGYDKSDTFCTAITNAIAGKSYHAIEYATGQKSDGRCVAESESKLIIFTLSEQKIQRIEELW